MIKLKYKTVEKVLANNYNTHCDTRLLTGSGTTENKISGFPKFGVVSFLVFFVFCTPLGPTEILSVTKTSKSTGKDFFWQFTNLCACPQSNLSHFLLGKSFGYEKDWIYWHNLHAVLKYAFQRKKSCTFLHKLNKTTHCCKILKDRFIEPSNNLTVFPIRSVVLKN